MKTTLTLLAALAIALFLVTAASPASAQLALVQTNLELTPAAPLAADALWDGSSTSGSVAVELCYDEGAFNPAGGGIVLTATVSAPGWVTATVSPMETTYSPPMGPMTEAGCDPIESFTVALSAPDGVEYSAAPSITVNIAVAEDADEETGVALLGTYSAPAGDSASFSVNTIPRPAADDDDEEDPASGPASSGDPTAESPAPAVGLLVLLAAGLVALRRRS